MKTIIFLIIITLLGFVIAKTFPLGVEASLPPHSPTVYGLFNRESIAVTMVWPNFRVYGMALSPRTPSNKVWPISRSCRSTAS